MSVYHVEIANEEENKIDHEKNTSQLQSKSEPHDQFSGKKKDSLDICFNINKDTSEHEQITTFSSSETPISEGKQGDCKAIPEPSKKR